MSSSVGQFDVAVFPLTNAVLFPGVSLPLHIFEDRYSEMLADVQARGWKLAVALAVPFSANRLGANSLGANEFCLNTICGAGAVEVFKRYPDGRSDILVHGQERVQLRGFVQQHPYFVMEAEIIPAHHSDLWTPPPSSDLDDLTALIKSWIFINPDVPEDIAEVFDDFASLGSLVDFFVFHFFKRAQDKQVYLNCSDPRQRAEMLARYLETDLVRLTRRVTQMRRVQLLH